MILLENEEQAFLQMVMGAEGIIEVDKLPTVNINTKSFYKTPSGLYWYGNGGFNKVLNRKDDNDIVTAAVGSSSNPGNYTPSVPGLVKLYNQSSGLRLDDAKQLCIAQARRGAEGEDGNDLLATEPNKSANRPITPANLQYALSQFVPLVTFNGSIAGAQTTNKTAASVGAVKTYGETLKTYADTSASSKASAALSSAESKINSKATETLNTAKSYTDTKVANAGTKLAIKRATIAPNGIWKINPGIFAIIFPWDKSTFLLNPETNDDVTLEGGVSLVWSTNPNGSQFDIAVLSLSGDILNISNLVQSHHHTYYTNNYCVVKNTITDSLGANETGNAYVYYIDFING